MKGLSFKKAVANAKRELLENGCIEGKLLFNKGDKLVCCPLLFNGDADKDAKQKALNHEFRSGIFKDVDEYYYVAEAWVGAQLNKDKPDMPPNIKPSMQVDRKEAMIVVQFCRDGKNEMFLQDFKRNHTGKTRLVGKPMVTKDVKQSMSKMNFFADPVALKKDWDKTSADQQEKFHNAMLEKLKVFVAVEFEAMVNDPSEANTKAFVAKVDEFATMEEKRIKSKLFEDLEQ